MGGAEENGERSQAITVTTYVPCRLEATTSGLHCRTSVGGLGKAHVLVFGRGLPNWVAQADGGLVPRGTKNGKAHCTETRESSIEIISLPMAAHGQDLDKAMADQSA